MSHLTIFVCYILGILKAGAKQDLVASFAPTEAKVTITSAVFTFKEGSKSVKKVLKMNQMNK